MRPVVSAQALFAVTPASVRRVVAAPPLRKPAAQAISHHATPVGRAPVQTVSRALPRIGAWPAGPGAMTKTGTDLPLSLALGGLLLALAAARGVAGMRHPKSDDDGHLSFGAI